MTTIDAALDNWRADLDYEAALDEGILKKWAVIALRQFWTSSVWDHSVCLIDIDNWSGDLPAGFKMSGIVAKKRDYKTRCTSDQVASWAAKVWGTDCELEVKLDCPECEPSTGSTAIATIDVDRFWEQANPQVFAGHMDAFVGYTKNVTEGAVNTQGNLPIFEVIRPAQQEMWNMQKYVPFCPPITADVEYNYKIDEPVIETNFEKGQVLMSYFAEKVDEEGYPLIPENVYALEAISAFINFKMADRRYLKNIKDANLRVSVRDAEERWERFCGRARNKMFNYTPDEWYNKIMNVWHRLYPNYGVHTDLGRNRPDRYGWDRETYDLGKSNRGFRTYGYPKR